MVEWFFFLKKYSAPQVNPQKIKPKIKTLWIKYKITISPIYINYKPHLRVLTLPLDKSCELLSSVVLRVDKVIWKFFNKITNKNPTTNSNPPNPKIKNVTDTEVRSSVYAPVSIEIVYKTSQVISAYNNNVTTVQLLKKKNPKHNK